MTRKGYKLIAVKRGHPRRTQVDRSVQDFSETMGYGCSSYANQGEYFARYSGRWMVELRQAIKSALRKDRKVLSVGSGECEFEVPLFQEGYAIVGSDVAPAALEPVRRLFPEFRAVVLDIFNPEIQERFDDVLIPGMDFYFPQEGVQSLLKNVKGLLQPGGRLLLVLRYRDNWLTRFIDYVGIPMECALRSVLETLKRSDVRYRFKFHGYRRAPCEIIALAERAGFHFQRMSHAGFGMELTRLHIDRFPRLFDLFHSVDTRLHWMNNAILMEFATSS